MKKTIIIIATTVVIGGAAYLIYRKKYGKPRVTDVKVDWEKGTASFVADGQATSLPAGQGLALKNGYTIEFVKSFYGGTQRMDNTMLALMKNGAIIDKLATRP